MEAVSKHLEHFSAGLFEEIMRFPYNVSTGSGAKGTGKPDTSHNIRLEKRRLRLVHVRDQTLEYRYVSLISDMFFIAFSSYVHCLFSLKYTARSGACWAS
jgi:hypothetical protein